MIEIIPDMPDNVVAVRAHGTVTAEDYDTVLIPAVEGKLKQHAKIRVLYQLAEDFSGFSAGAMWEDARVGLGHLTAYERIAVVTDATWVIGAVKLLAFMIPCPVRTFTNDRLAEAKAWLSAERAGGPATSR